MLDFPDRGGVFENSQLFSLPALADRQPPGYLGSIGGESPAVDARQPPREIDQHGNP